MPLLLQIWLAMLDRVHEEIVNGRAGAGVSV